MEMTKENKELLNEALLATGCERGSLLKKGQVVKGVMASGRVRYIMMNPRKDIKQKTFSFTQRFFDWCDNHIPDEYIIAIYEEGNPTKGMIVIDPKQQSSGGYSLSLTKDECEEYIYHFTNKFSRQ